VRVTVSFYVFCILFSENITLYLKMSEVIFGPATYSNFVICDLVIKCFWI